MADGGVGQPAHDQGARARSGRPRRAAPPARRRAGPSSAPGGTTPSCCTSQNAALAEPGGRTLGDAVAGHRLVEARRQGDLEAGAAPPQQRLEALGGAGHEPGRRQPGEQARGDVPDLAAPVVERAPRAAARRRRTARRSAGAGTRPARSAARRRTSRRAARERGPVALAQPGEQGRPLEPGAGAPGGLLVGGARGVQPRIVLGGEPAAAVAGAGADQRPQVGVARPGVEDRRQLLGREPPPGPGQSSSSASASRSRRPARSSASSRRMRGPATGRSSCGARWGGPSCPGVGRQAARRATARTAARASRLASAGSAGTSSGSAADGAGGGRRWVPSTAAPTSSRQRSSSVVTALPGSRNGRRRWRSAA